MEAAADSSAAADDPQLLLQEEQHDDDTSSNGDVSGGKSIPAPLYTQNQRVYAKDETTGLLYPAMIRKAMWGPKSESSLPIPALLELANKNNDASGDSGEAGNDTGTNQNMEEADEEEDDEDEDDHRTDPKLNCHSYYVHYMGWNVRWDRWVNEVFLYDHSNSTKLLAEKIQKEYEKVKPKKKGQKMSVSQVSRWMKKMVEVELDHRKMEREGKFISESCGTSSEGNVGDASKNDCDTSDPAEDKDGSETAKPVVAADEMTKVKDVAKPIVKEETLHKQAQLRARGLQLKRKRIHADRLHLPFTLKKILVEEWEVISQCGMLYDLPSNVSVRDALNSYLESKLLPSREKKQLDNNNITTSGQKGGGDIMEVDDDNDEKQSAIGDREKEWNNMVEGIALLFDQALPVHLLFEEERTQYSSLRRQILAQRRRAAYNYQPDAMKAQGVNDSETDAGANKNYGHAKSEKCSTDTGSETSDDNKPLPDRMSEIYGCEHLLRLFIRLPAVVAATPSISEPDARRIFSKLGDLVRYIQKHQSEIFKSTFRKPLQSEIRKIVKEKVAED